MKIVYLDLDNTIREIIPDYALPIEEYYSNEFVSRCVEAPDYVEQRWMYDSITNTFNPPLLVDDTVLPTYEERLIADVDFALIYLGHD